LPCLQSTISPLILTHTVTTMLNDTFSCSYCLLFPLSCSTFSQLVFTTPNTPCSTILFHVPTAVVFPLSCCPVYNLQYLNSFSATL
jgi:hypothetical protein